MVVQKKEEDHVTESKYSSFFDDKLCLYGCDSWFKYFTCGYFTHAF